MNPNESLAPSLAPSEAQIIGADSVHDAHLEFRVWGVGFRITSKQGLDQCCWAEGQRPDRREGRVPPQEVLGPKLRPHRLTSASLRVQTPEALSLNRTKPKP